MSAPALPRLRPVDPAADAELLHGWVSHPRSAYWQMSGLSVAEVREAYDEIDRHPHHAAWVGELEDGPMMLGETYDPRRSELGGLTHLDDLADGDVGMHVLVAPPAGPPVHGLTRRAFATMMRHCLETLGAARVVVEPDVRNAAIARLNADAGFTVDREVDLADKRAALSFCTPAAFAASPIGDLL